jgi:hypothetical protein
MLLPARCHRIPKEDDVTDESDLVPIAVGLAGVELGPSRKI